ncbi:hypothetical protein Tco_0365973 [Tanacetum coccineum]
MGKIEREWDGGFDYTLRGRRKTTASQTNNVYRAGIMGRVASADAFEVFSSTLLNLSLVLSSCFVFLVPSVGFISWLPVKRDLHADDSATITSGSLLAVVDNAELVGAFIGIGIGSGAAEERFGGSCGGSSDSGSVDTRSVVWGGSCAVGVGRRSVGCCGGCSVMGNSGFGKTVSKTKFGLFEVLIVSKWNSKVWVVPSSFLRESGRWNRCLSVIWVRISLQSTVKEFACSLKQVMEMVVIQSLTIALK